MYLGTAVLELNACEHSHNDNANMVMFSWYSVYLVHHVSLVFSHANVCLISTKLKVQLRLMGMLLVFDYKDIQVFDKSIWH